LIASTYIAARARRCFRAERGVGKDVGEERIVDLQQEPGVDDRLVFGAQRGADGVEEFFLAAVVLVDPTPLGATAGMNAALMPGAFQSGLEMSMSRVSASSPGT